VDVVRAAALIFGLATLPGCLGARSRAERVELEVNPLSNARAGEFCRYKAIRDGEAGKRPVEEEWSLHVRSIAGGAARVEVEILGPGRDPPGPSPREPGYSVLLQTKDEGFTGTQLLRLLRRPELSPRGIRRWLDDAVNMHEASIRDLPVVFEGKTRPGHEVVLDLEDGRERTRYRLVIVDDVAVCAIVEADLDETWLSDTPDGELHEEHRHDHLSLVEWKR
jgi:hypothetical protein